MNNFQTILVNSSGIAGYIALNRPRVHNAFNAEMISELRQAFSEFNGNSELRLIVIRANGKSFSSGADLNYMREQAEMDERQNKEDSEKLARLFYEIYASDKMVITVSHGNISGGANGIIAASDYAITAKDSVFRFSEVTLGLVPATISPYIIDRMGRARSMELMLTGKKFSGSDAETYGLVNKAVESMDLEKELGEILGYLRKTGPAATQKTKKLLLWLNDAGVKENMIIPTSELIAEARSSEEGREGIKAFFEKRNPNWINESI
jgi:methylglutaconyl-CoA hydratase